MTQSPKKQREYLRIIGECKGEVIMKVGDKELTRNDLLSAAHAANKEQKALADQFARKDELIKIEGQFALFHKGKPELGSAGWLVSPYIVQNWLASYGAEIKQKSYEEGYRVGSNAKAIPVFNNFEIFKDKGKHFCSQSSRTEKINKEWGSNHCRFCVDLDCKFKP